MTHLPKPVAMEADRILDAHLFQVGDVLVNDYYPGRASERATVVATFYRSGKSPEYQIRRDNHLDGYVVSIPQRNLLRNGWHRLAID